MYFFALLATSFGHYSHHQDNIVQKLKYLKMFGFTYT